MNRFFKDLKKYFKYMIYATKAELNSEVAGSYLGWLWWFLEPFCFMMVYAFLCIFIFKTQEPFMLAFIFIGNSIWTFFNKCLTQSVKLIQTNKGIISKVYVPKYTLVMKTLFVNLFKLLVSLLLVAGLMVYYKVPVNYTIIEIIPLLILLFLGTFALSLFLTHFGVFIQDLSNVVNIILRLVFYFSGIFYNISKQIPAPYGKLLVRVNPIAFIIDQARSCLLHKTNLDWIFLGSWMGISLLLTILGLATIYKYENSYVKVVG